MGVTKEQVRLAHASSLGSWGGRKRRGCNKRAGAP